VAHHRRTKPNLLLLHVLDILQIQRLEQDRVALIERLALLLSTRQSHVELGGDQDFTGAFSDRGGRERSRCHPLQVVQNAFVDRLTEDLLLAADATFLGEVALLQVVEELEVDRFGPEGDVFCLGQLERLVFGYGCQQVVRMLISQADANILKEKINIMVITIKESRYGEP